MRQVECHYLNVGPTAPRKLTPALPLPGESSGLCRTFHRELIARPAGFNSQIQMQGLALVRLQWEPIGQTAGALIFPPFVYRPGRRNPDILSLLLNGVESPEELSELAKKFAVPDPIWQKVLSAEKPAAFTMVFEAGRVRDPATITILGAFANSFFSIFGTNEIEAPLMGS